jgi:hypothetical protein
MIPHGVVHRMTCLRSAAKRKDRHFAGASIRILHPQIALHPAGSGHDLERHVKQPAVIE